MVWRGVIRDSYPYKRYYRKRFYKHYKDDRERKNALTTIPIRYVEIIGEFDKGNYKLVKGIVDFCIPKNYSLPKGIYDPIIVEPRNGFLWIKKAKLDKMSLEIKEENLQDIYEVVKFLAQKASGSNESNQVELIRLIREADKVGISYKVFDKIIEKLESKGYIEIMEGNKGDKKIRIVIFKK